MVRPRVRRADGGPVAGVAGDRDRRAHADLRPDRLGQDARRVPVGARPARRRAVGRPHAARLRLAAEGALLRRGEEPARAAARDRRRREGRDPHGRHAAEGPARHGPPPARHPDHDARVALPDADQPGARDLRGRRAGDRGRDPRRRADQARRAPRAHARAARRAGRPRPAADRAVGDAEPARGGRALPRRAEADLHDRRHRHAQAARPEDPRAGGDHGRAGAVRPRPRSRSPGRRRRASRSGRRSTPSCSRRCARTARRSSSSTTAARPSGWRCGSTSSREEPIARAHHGSLAREERLDRRGAAQGRRAALPRRDLVARARHRHGRRRPRAAGRVAEVGHRRAAAHRPLRPRRRRHRQGPHLPQVPRRPARVRGRRAAHARGPDRAHRRAAQPARRARPADRRDGGLGRDRGRRRAARARHCARTRSPSSRARSSRTCSTCSTAAIPSEEFGELRPRIVWDRVGGTIRARKGARALAITNAGTIPDRGLFSVNLPDGRRVGELDEEMVYEARPGQVFLLGASSWRIEEITRDRVVVTPAPGVPGAVPFWKGDGVGRPRELGEAIGAFARWAVEQDAATLADGYDLDPLRRAEPARLPARAAGRHARRPERPDDRRRALPRRDRRLAPVRPLPLRRPRARRLGPRAERADPRGVRARVRRDLVRRRDHRAPARRR